MTNVIAVDFRPRATWERVVARQFVTRWNDGATAERALILWIGWLHTRRTVPADAAPEVWDWLWELFLRTPEVRALEARYEPEGAA